VRRLRPRRCNVALAALVLGAGALAAGCGVPVTSSPEVLPASAVHYNLLSPAPPPFPLLKTTPKGDIDIFLVDTENDELVAVARPAGGNPGAQQALNDLVQGPTPAEQFDGLASDLAPLVPLAASGPDARGVVTVNLGQNFGDTLPSLAVAQMVWTVSRVHDVTGVLFVENGTVVHPPTQGGAPVHRPLTTADFTSYFA
jgi:Sporulation and spore germination